MLWLRSLIPIVTESLGARKGLESEKEEGNQEFNVDPQASDRCEEKERTLGRVLEMWLSEN